MTEAQKLTVIQTTGFAFESNDFSMNGGLTCNVVDPQHPLPIGEWDEYGNEDESEDDETIPIEIDPDLEDEEEDAEDDDEFYGDEEISDDEDDEFEKYLHGEDDE
ncbi:MAG: hypothetical protein QF718_05895 [Phycisphaerales bacterium]|jgi:hypothetical protein|nr:hypothetical protein [Phycisphaerales bacterium]